MEKWIQIKTRSLATLCMCIHFLIDDDLLSVQNDVIKMGIFNLFNRLFEDHGELLGLFNKFRELKTKEEQASSEELAEHANKVMETLDEGIRSLDELDTFFEYLSQVGASHTRIPEFKSEYFWVSYQTSFAQILLK